MGTLLEVRNLKKYFDVPKGHLHAVDNVSFKINEGETLGIVGESGCGKSTLGRVILRLHEATAGSVLFDGMNVTRMDKQELRSIRKYMQIIFQDPYASLNPRFTVAQIIEEPLRLHKIYPSEKQIRARVEELMDMVGLSTRMYNAYPHEFDGGRRQRIVVARALAINPRFIVCDEPVSALDVSIQAQILNLMIDLQKELNLTYIFISHNLSVVKHISTNVGVMYLGQLIEMAPKRAIYKNPLHPYTVALLSAIPSLDPDAKREQHILKGELTSPVNPKPGCRFSARCSFAQERCFSINPALEEVEPNHFVACHRVSEFTGAE
ncbi:dipeptide ABC transporter ATP-binding protein [Ruminococcaceae bacterium OttesenSCG-928-D13]|nr:dipeptide ABC transporter ATP-binding protein [Ruminococcaceae bacterium OttesenSCG-928-D13]